MSYNFEDPRSKSGQSDESDDSDSSETDESNVSTYSRDSEQRESDVEDSTETTENNESLLGKIMPTDSESETTNDETSVSASAGFAENGMTGTETVSFLGYVAASLVMAGFILVKSVQHGLHHTPPLLMGVFVFLVVSPFFVLFGTSLGMKVLTMLLDIRSGSSNHSDDSQDNT